MRIASNTHAHLVPIQVWHVPSCKPIKRVVWVDDESHQYGAHGDQIMILHGEVLTHTVQCRKVVILLEQRLVLVDPLDDQIPDHLFQSFVAPKEVTQ